MEKLMKYAGIIDNFLKVIWFILIGASIAGIIATLVGTIATQSSALSSAVDLGQSTITSGLLKIWLHQSVITADNLRVLFIATAVEIFFSAVIMLLMIRQLRGIVRTMKDGRPFGEEVPSKIRKLAYIIFVYALVTPLIDMLPNFFLYRLYDIERVLLTSPLIEKVQLKMSYDWNLMTLLIGFGVILLSFVFEYGAKLQQQSDETL